MEKGALHVKHFALDTTTMWDIGIQKLFASLHMRSCKRQRATTDFGALVAEC